MASSFCASSTNPSRPLPHQLPQLNLKISFRSTSQLPQPAPAAGYRLPRPTYFSRIPLLLQNPKPPPSCQRTLVQYARSLPTSVFEITSDPIPCLLVLFRDLVRRPLRHTNTDLHLCGHLLLHSTHLFRCGKRSSLRLHRLHPPHPGTAPSLV